MRHLYKILILLMITTCATFLSADDADKIKAYEMKKLKANSRIEVLNLDLIYTKDLKKDNWVGYSFDIEFLIKEMNETANAKDVIFSNGVWVTSNLIDLKTGKTLKDVVRPRLSKKYYNTKRLIAGSKNAKHKIVVFSDPLCPFCKQTMPKLIEHVKKYSKNVALYYYDFPLAQLHLASKTIAKASILANMNNVKDVEEKIYNAKFSKYFLPDEKNNTKILKAVNKILGTNYTLTQINDKKVVDFLNQGKQMGDDVWISGTPTIFIDSQYTSKNDDYKNYK